MTEGSLIFWAIVAVLAVAVGLVVAVQSLRHQAIVAGSPSARRPGWVYFLSPVGGGLEDPPEPIKIGMTHRDPAVDRLPEIETMSPTPLEILALIYSETPEILEHVIHRELAPFRRHGEWFDRDATLAWLDHYNEGASE